MPRKNAKRALDEARQQRLDESCRIYLEHWCEKGEECPPEMRSFILSRFVRNLPRKKLSERIRERVAANRSLRHWIEPQRDGDRGVADAIEKKLIAYNSKHWEQDRRDGLPVTKPMRGLMFKVLSCRNGKVPSAETIRKDLATPGGKSRKPAG